MSVTIKHLNEDASFLLTFRPILPFPPTPEQADAHTFTIILDPWLSGSSDVFHPVFSSTRQKEEACITSLRDLPEADIILISQNMPDHCHKKTLKELPSHLGKTQILAQSDAAATINSWKYFEPSKITPIRRWDAKRRERTFRVCLPPLDVNGESGEVTITYLEDNWNKDNMARVHNAIGITYTPPTHGEYPHIPAAYSAPMTPPTTPSSSAFFSLRETSSNRPLSIIFSPHGCNYSTLASYASNHLYPIGALPLTALLHCFDEVRNTWYLGGKICNGLPGGVGIAQKLRARVWISAHDADKVVSGFSTKLLEIKKFDREEVEAIVSPKSADFAPEDGTRAIVLRSGEEMVLSQVMDFGRPEKSNWI